jgi:hypothetical protein
MSTDERDEAIVARVRRALDERANALDPETRVRLRAARLRALDALEERRAFGARAALAAAAAGLAGIGLFAAWWLREPPLALEGLEDVEILAAAEDWELYDDLDFYRWLEEDGAI